MLHIPIRTRHAKQSTSFKALLQSNLVSHRSIIIEAAIATAVVNLLALGASLFSMQVYDRVIPSNGIATVVILSSGVGLVIVLELVLKLARSRVMDQFIIGLD